MPKEIMTLSENEMKLIFEIIGERTHALRNNFESITTIIRAGLLPESMCHQATTKDTLIQRFQGDSIAQAEDAIRYNKATGQGGECIESHTSEIIGGIGIVVANMKTRTTDKELSAEIAAAAKREIERLICTHST